MKQEQTGTVLVVDDEAANLGVLFEFLREAGYKVLVAEDGTAALEVFYRSQPDIIFLDVKMPDMDGFELYSRMKESGLAAHTPVIFLSVLAESEHIIQGLDLNAVDYITKPFQPLEVVARMAKHLALRNLRRQLDEQNVQLQREIAERITIENSLRVERDNFFNILEAMPDGIYIVDQEYNIQYANSSLRDEFGLVEGRKCFTYFHKREEVCPWCQNPKVFEGETVRWEWQSEQNQRIYDLIDTPLESPDGTVWKLEIFRDITERKLMEEALRKNERSLAKAQNVTKVGHYEWDLTGNTISWSDELYRIFGVDKATHTSTVENFAEFVHPDDLHMISPESVAKTISVENHEFDFRIVDQITKEIKHVHLWGETIFGQDGEPAQIMGILQDITDRVVFQEALNEKSSYLDNILSSATEDAIVTTDLDFRITYFNPVAEKFYGLLAGEAVGKLVSEIRPVNPTDEAFRHGLTNLRDDGEHRYETIVEIDGQLRDIRSRLSGIYNQEGDLIGYARFSRDVTDRMRSEKVSRDLAVLEERQRLADDLHDAVTQMLFSASLISDVLPRVWQQNPDEGMQNLAKLRRLTREALLEMRMLLLEMRPDNLIEKDLAELLVQLSGAITTRSGLPVDVQLAGEFTPPPEVQVALYRIVQEALNNIAKHAEATRAIITMQRQVTSISLCISDDGIGFDPDDIRSGHLGMVIMRERAEKVGAELTIDSVLGEGTQVNVFWEKEPEK
jgi:PAS domain S-box-containing protein